ncbi:hypothetical protein CONCODRAFT_3278 [Conidiobolus coronatus NRRL 28638]|uniref:G-protein coupled receptors family 1 profile domain-containing protein n=1 Tax=Conidiobolus coronatus (strain ATCC 28846 / CBS 209.66 / NRRL 28638) TaxID=796925 RepID=A0A137PFD5_CONC2|nr:hypothetical protein CONCODRAFT_3278 [Conidiobolus coronatus NRRL 28638]|eukprot:KXN73718.1 hypothetical protein CONCODRAFT_3278 [Conidiobolus coronatus NRRL 28638]
MSSSKQINLILNPIGMTCASFVIISIVGIAIINRQLANRMTVRLIAVIALTDLLAHVGEYYAITHSTLTAGTPACTAVNGFRLFARTFYCWINMAISFHIYRSLVQLKKTNWKSEVYFWTATAVFVVAETLVYYGLGAFTGVPARKRCTPGVDDYSKNLVFILFQSLTNLFTIAVSTFTEEGGDRDHLINERRKLAFRSFLYPLSTIVTLPFEAIFLIFNGFGAYVIELFVVMVIGSGLSGVLTALAFGVDPATHKSFKTAYYLVKNRNSHKKDLDEQYGLGSNDIQL